MKVVCAAVFRQRIRILALPRSSGLGCRQNPSFLSIVVPPSLLLVQVLLISAHVCGGFGVSVATHTPSTQSRPYVSRLRRQLEHRGEPAEYLSASSEEAFSHPYKRKSLRLTLRGGCKTPTLVHLRGSNNIDGDRKADESPAAPDWVRAREPSIVVIGDPRVGKTTLASEAAKR